ncbi:hypothetical protein CEP10_07915 [Cylindrospermopsis raciborskii S07]|uniref:Uncharacterized protein n=2 Tax=Cylindrospermopsis raciborskii TaxID=77022 RepID=A0A853MAR7_9CYAN|nr:hypothetical protein [Cylindrospermopsis raciborskii]MBA4449954.1 hypothetical protein [Cylindrospermopsis raciborskii CS-506_D]MBA4465922.1 hypothetical protein [Cylindrospermopsis raciborskii CS-506_A]OBU76331.1 hypothetical protein A9P98_08345 [Cylindrospermopsis raciborskii CS-505]PNK01668.1 hypothetical protein CEP11_16780 [Cylindrospermopsis raciborskii S10]PNK02000.1 hypothetical protein CEP12_17675 [Cylindrospermopsis raciborskii S14]
MKLIAIAILWTSGVITKGGKNLTGDRRNSDRSLARGISNISSVRKTSGMVNYVVLKEDRSREISNTSEWN